MRKLFPFIAFNQIRFPLSVELLKCNERTYSRGDSILEKTETEKEISSNSSSSFLKIKVVARA